jgi:large subunit ribosomal protein L24
MRKIKKGDLVQVMSGKDRGKSGKVLSIDTVKQRVCVEGCNMRVKHTKANAQNPKGGIINQEGSMHISNVMILVDGKPSRVGFEIKDGKKHRIAKKTGKTID